MTVKQFPGDALRDRVIGGKLRLETPGPLDRARGVLAGQAVDVVVQFLEESAGVRINITGLVQFGAEFF